MPYPWKLQNSPPWSSNFIVDGNLQDILTSTNWLCQYHEQENPKFRIPNIVMTLCCAASHWRVGKGITHIYWELTKNNCCIFYNWFLIPQHYIQTQVTNQWWNHKSNAVKDHFSIIFPFYVYYDGSSSKEGCWNTSKKAISF